jgi:hypothetical protein
MPPERVPKRIKKKGKQLSTNYKNIYKKTISLYRLAVVPSANPQAAVVSSLLLIDSN